MKLKVKQPKNTSVRPKNANSSKKATINSRQELVVQRLSSELSGKTPKYAPIGPWDSVPYTYDDVTIECIKLACVRHFKIWMRNLHMQSVMF